MARKKQEKSELSYQEEIEALDEQRRNALTQGDYGAYSMLCDELGVDPEDALAYERGNLDRRQLIPIEELTEEGLEQVVKKEEVVIDDSRFGDVTRSYLAANNCRGQGNLKTNNPKEYAAWIVGAFLDSTQRQKGYGVKVESSSGVGSGRMRRVHMDALFYERVNGRGRYRTEYSVGFDESHDDMDRTNPGDYQADQLVLLRDLVSQVLTNANVVVKDRCLYVFKKSE